MSTVFTIGQLSLRTVTKAETIRYYEKIGLLASPARSQANYRHYTEVDRRRLAFVRRARELGLPIAQIRDLIELETHGDQECGAVDELVRSQIRSIEEKVRDLQALNKELTRILSHCPGGLVSECRVLGALQAPVGPAKHGGIQPPKR